MLSNPLQFIPYFFLVVLHVEYVLKVQMSNRNCLNCWLSSFYALLFSQISTMPCNLDILFWDLDSVISGISHVS